MTTLPNIRHLVGSADGLAFFRPGFESATFKLNSHHLTDLLEPEQWQVINAAARIKERESLTPHDNLVDLEHDRLRDLMLGAEVGQVQKDDPVHRWWTTCAHLSGHLQRRKPFRQDSQGRLHYTLLPIDESELSFFRLSDDSEPTDLGLSPKGLAREIELPTGPRINAWAVPRYLDALRELADVQEVELRDCAMKYGTIDLPGRKPEQIWRYHEFLGFSRYRGQ